MLSGRLRDGVRAETPDFRFFWFLEVSGCVWAHCGDCFGGAHGHLSRHLAMVSTILTALPGGWSGPNNEPHVP